MINYSREGFSGSYHHVCKPTSELWRQICTAPIVEINSKKELGFVPIAVRKWERPEK
jgi:hypothetical protein